MNQFRHKLQLQTVIFIENMMHLQYRCCVMLTNGKLKWNALDRWCCTCSCNFIWLFFMWNMMLFCIEVCQTHQAITYLRTDSCSENFDENNITLQSHYITQLQHQHTAEIAVKSVPFKLPVGKHTFRQLTTLKLYKFIER